VWGKTRPGLNEVARHGGGDSEVDRMPLNMLNTSELVGGQATSMNNTVVKIGVMTGVTGDLKLH